MLTFVGDGDVDKAAKYAVTTQEVLNPTMSTIIVISFCPIRITPYFLAWFTFFCASIKKNKIKNEIVLCGGGKDQISASNTVQMIIFSVYCDISFKHSCFNWKLMSSLEKINSALVVKE